MDGNGAWNQQNNQGQQYDQYGRPIQNQWNNSQYGQQYSQQMGDYGNHPGNQYVNLSKEQQVQQAWGDTASQNMYGRVEQNNLQYGYNTQPYKKSKAGIFITIGILGVVVAIIAAVVLLARALFGGAGVKEVTGDITLSEVEDFIINDEMAEDLSFEKSGITVECLGLTSGELGSGFYLDNYLAFVITNKSGRDIKIYPELYVNDFLSPSVLYDSNSKSDYVIKNNTKGLYFANSTIYFVEDATGLKDKEYDKFIINWEILDKDYKLVTETTTTYNEDKDRILESQCIEDGYTEIANYGDLRLYAKVEIENEDYLKINYYGVSETPGRISVDFPDLGIKLKNSDVGTHVDYARLDLQNSQDVYTEYCYISDFDVVDSTSKNGKVYNIENSNDVESIILNITVEDYEFGDTIKETSFEYKLK